ncbi:MAG: glutamate ligase domain-containing protein, partial [Candidatus Binatia bacterium]
TSIEFDHADIYRDLDHVTEAFVRLLRLVPAGGPVLASADFPRVEKALYKTARPAERFGVAQTAEWRPERIRDEGGRTCFDVRFQGRAEGEVSMRLMGEMNVRNALGVFALCRRLGLAADAIGDGIESFRGVRRRQEVLVDRPVTVIDDFAHHPTAIAGTLEAVRRRHPGRRLWAVFEPRSNTSRRRVFQRDFPAALGGADRVVLAEVFFKETDVLAPAERLSVADIVAELHARGHEARTCPTADEILDHLRREVADGDVVVFMSNGAFGGAPQRFAASVRERRG